MQDKTLKIILIANFVLWLVDTRHFSFNVINIIQLVLWLTIIILFIIKDRRK